MLLQNLKREKAMAKPYSYDLRIKALDLINSGKTVTFVSNLFKIARSTLHAWINLKKTKNDIHPQENYQKGYDHKITNLFEFKKFVDENNVLTLKQMGKILGVDKMTVSRAMEKIGYVKKKDLWLYRTR